MANEKETKKLYLEATEATAEWIKAHYGKRCKSYSPGCPSCDKWMQFDLLFQETECEYTWMTLKRRVFE